VRDLLDEGGDALRQLLLAADIGGRRRNRANFVMVILISPWGGHLDHS